MLVSTVNTAQKLPIATLATVTRSPHTRVIGLNAAAHHTCANSQLGVILEIHALFPHTFPYTPAWSAFYDAVELFALAGMTLADHSCLHGATTGLHTCHTRVARNPYTLFHSHTCIGGLDAVELLALAGLTLADNLMLGWIQDNRSHFPPQLPAHCLTTTPRHLHSRP